jgi:hypothetical protein
VITEDTDTSQISDEAASKGAAYSVMQSDEDSLVSESESLPQMVKSMMLDKNKSR